MKKFKIILLAIICVYVIENQLKAQVLPGSYTTTWSGNSFSGNPDWVQGYMYSAAISPDGKVFTIAHWDEAHKECGIYQDGKAVGRIYTTGFVIAGNHSNVFVPSGTSVKKYNFDGSDAGQSFNLGISPTYMAVNKNFIVASENGSNSVVVINLNSGALVKRWTVKDPTAVAIDSNNFVWIVSGEKLPEDRFERKWLVYDSTYLPRIYKYNSLGEKQTDSIFLYNKWRPTCMAIDNNTNKLMIGDDGPKHQVTFFDIENTPSLVKSFGTEGGIGAGDPGIITPTKLWALKGLGTDATGNIYVIIGEDGSVIRSLKPTGELNWELNAANFVDVMNFDQYSDGRFLYGKNEIVEMDYSKTEPGTEWNMLAYTQDRISNSYDPRNFYTALGHEFSSMWPRIIEGDMYMFAAGMYGIKPNVFKFNGKIASPAAYLKLNGSIAFFQDKEGSYWEASGNQIIKTPITAIEKNGDLIYGKPEKVSDIPSPFSSISRILYDEDNDIMYLTGNDKIARYDNWSKGNRNSRFVGAIVAPYNQSVAVAGDYIFTCGVQTKSRIKVYSALDFTYLGMLEAGDAVGGPENTGWVDIPYGLNAIKRSNGEYIIAIEDDYKMKSIIFRWCPTGNCKQNPPTVKFNGLVNKTTLLPGGSITIDVSAEDKNGTVDSVQLFADTVLLTTSKVANFSYNWQNISEGKYYILAKAYDNDGLSATTYPIRVYVTHPDSENPSDPANLQAKDIKTTYATLCWNNSTDNIEIAGYKILRNGQIQYVSGGSDTSFIATELLPNTNYDFSVIAFDKALNLSDTSNVVKITTKSDGPYSGTPVQIPGIVELEHYDNGGEGISYHDVDEHIGGTYRDDENVDISTTNDGFYVGWIEIDEWLRFTVNIEKEGDYDAYIVSAGGGGSVNLNFSNGDKNYTLDYVSTGDWGKWKTSVKANIHLLPGIQYFKLNMNNNQVSIDKIIIKEHVSVNPQTPVNLKLDTIKNQMVFLKWAASGDEGTIKEYRLYVDGLYHKTTPLKSINSKKLAAGKSYEFAVTSIDLVGNESEKSNVVTVYIEDLSVINNTQKTDAVSVYPIPASNFVTLKTTNSVGANFTLSVVDYSGKVVILKRITNSNGRCDFSVSSLAKGFYFVKVQDKNCTYTKPLIVR